MKNIHTDHVDVGDKVAVSPLLSGTVTGKVKVPDGEAITVKSDGLSVDVFKKGK